MIAFSASALSRPSASASRVARFSGDAVIKTRSAPELLREGMGGGMRNDHRVALGRDLLDRVADERPHVVARRLIQVASVGGAPKVGAPVGHGGEETGDERLATFLVGNGLVVDVAAFRSARDDLLVDVDEAEPLAHETRDLLASRPERPRDADDRSRHAGRGYRSHHTGVVHRGGAVGCAP